jgi:Protein of unknown function (DUF3105)
MAKQKPRTPTPPRQVQAPRPRTGGSSGDDLGLRHRNALYLVAGVGIVALVAVGIFFAVGGGSKSKDSAARLTSLFHTAGCTFKTVDTTLPAGAPMHVTSLTVKMPWNTDPPSSGQHYAGWAIWGFYTEPVNPRMVVHNEEHGGVILWWGPKVPSATVDKLRSFYDQQTTGVFGTPYPNLGSKIAITAWTGNPARYQTKGYYGQGHIAVCPGYDAATEKAFAAFRSAYRGHGPEGVPLAADKAGLGPQSQ